MPTISDEIARAMQALEISAQACRAVRGDEARTVFQRVEARCVTRPGCRWWWEALADPNATHAFAEPGGFARLNELVPDPTERVWFIADPDEPDYAVYDTSVVDAQRIIGECHAVEYALASKDLAWAVGENHHGVTWAFGAPVVARLIVAAQQ
jgi:hypothetical protein